MEQVPKARHARDKEPVRKNGVLVGTMEVSHRVSQIWMQPRDVHSAPFVRLPSAEILRYVVDEMFSQRDTGEYLEPRIRDLREMDSELTAWGWV